MVSSYRGRYSVVAESPYHQLHSIMIGHVHQQEEQNGGHGQTCRTPDPALNHPMLRMNGWRIVWLPWRWLNRLWKHTLISVARHFRFCRATLFRSVERPNHTSAFIAREPTWAWARGPRRCTASRWVRWGRGRGRWRWSPPSWGGASPASSAWTGTRRSSWWRSCLCGPGNRQTHSHLIELQNTNKKRKFLCHFISHRSCVCMWPFKFLNLEIKGAIRHGDATPRGHYFSFLQIAPFYCLF